MMNGTSQPWEFDFDAVFEADDYIYFYQESLTEERTEEEVKALVNLVCLEKPMKILDLACGFGRHSNRLASLGHDVTGVDLYADFLEIARRDAQAKEVHVNYVQSDMQKIEYNEEFDRVLLLFTAFGYFDDVSNIKVLSKIYHALKFGGMFVFDILNRDTYLKYISPIYITEIGDDLMVDRVSFDAIRGRTNNRRFVIRNGVRKDKPFSIRLYNVNEITNLLLNENFTNIRYFGNWDGTPFDNKSHRLIVIAEK